MRRFRIIGLALVAMMAIGAAAAVSASASAPEFGRCVKAPKHSTGPGFSDRSCTEAVSENGKYEWIAGPGPKPGFTTSAKFRYTKYHRPCSVAVAETRLAEAQRAYAAGLGEPEKAEYLKEAAHHEERAKEHLEAVKQTLEQCETRLVSERAKTPVIFETVGGTVAECGTVSGGGEITGPKSTGNIVLKFGECTMGANECSSSGAAAGEIVSSSLEGNLGVVVGPSLGKPAIIGLSLSGAGHGTAFAFTCGTETVVVTGAAIHVVKSDSMGSKESLSFAQKKGKQEIEAFEGGATEVLQTSISGGLAEQSGLTLRAGSRDQEKFEINAFA